MGKKTVQVLLETDTITQLESEAKDSHITLSARIRQIVEGRCNNKCDYANLSVKISGNDLGISI